MAEPPGVLMDDNWDPDDDWPEAENMQLFDSLHELTEFTVTEDHLKLLRRVYVDRWDPGEGVGAVGVNSKKPYGNSDVAGDVARIVDAPDEDWLYEHGHKAYVTDEAAERFMRLHVEAMVALQIVLATGEFRPGRYWRSRWCIDWQRDEDSQ